MTDVKLAEILRQPLPTIKSQKRSHGSKKLLYAFLASFEEDELKSRMDMVIKEHDFTIYTVSEILAVIAEELSFLDEFKSFTFTANKEFQMDRMTQVVDIYAVDEINNKEIIFDYSAGQSSSSLLKHASVLSNNMRKGLAFDTRIVYIKHNAKKFSDQEQDTGDVIRIKYMPQEETLYIDSQKVIVI